MAMEGDFEIKAEVVDPHPKFSAAFQAIQKKDEFLLTMNDAMIVEDLDDSDDELNITEMIHRAHTLTKSHFKGLSSVGGLDSQASIGSFMDDSIGEDSHRGLIDKGAQNDNNEAANDDEKDIAKIKLKIANRLEEY